MAKETRREIRRAVGEEALGIIDAHTKIIDHALLPNVNALTAARDNLENRIRLLEHLVGAGDAGAKIFRAMPWRQRWRWLIMGR